MRKEALGMDSATWSRGAGSLVVPCHEQAVSTGVALLT